MGVGGVFPIELCTFPEVRQINVLYVHYKCVPSRINFSIHTQPLHSWETLFQKEEGQHTVGVKETLVKRNPYMCLHMFFLYLCKHKQKIKMASQGLFQKATWWTIFCRGPIEIFQYFMQYYFSELIIIQHNTALSCNCKSHVL